MRETEVVTTKYLNVFTDEIFDSAEEAEEDENDFLMNHQGVHFFSYKGEELNFHDFYDEEVRGFGFDLVQIIYFESPFAAEWFNKEFFNLLDIKYYCGQPLKDSFLLNFKPKESMYIINELDSDASDFYIPISDFSEQVNAWKSLVNKWENKKKALDSAVQK